MFSTRSILISLVFIVFVLITLWSMSDQNTSSTSISPLPSPSTDDVIIHHHDSESSKQTTKEETNKNNQRAPKSPVKTIEEAAHRQSTGNHDDENENEENKYWKSSSYHYRNSPISSQSIMGIRQCRPLGRTFARAVAKWLNEIQYHDNTEHHHTSEDDGQQEENEQQSNRKRRTIKRRLIYSCESHRRGKFCGGMGDRFRGMVSSAFLALLANRRYEIFHPVPVALQQFLRPRFIDWVPKIREQVKSTSILKDASGFKEIDEHMQSIPLHRELMNLKRHKMFIPYFLTPPATNAVENIDLRIQSNTPGFDKYILRDSILKKRFQEELGLPLQCNLTCYYGCMYGLLFEPSNELEEEMKKSLSGFEVSAEISSSKPKNDDTNRNTNTNNNNKMIPLSKAVVDTHRGKRSQLVPILGLQVRVGGSWASNFTAKEPFRTIPSAFPFIFQDVKYLLSNYHGKSSSSLPVFVTSDSYKFIVETERNIGGTANTNQKVFSISGDCFQHTDTQNVNEAIPEKYKHLKTKKQQKRAAYLCTLMNHVVLSASELLVMGQSGFADSAFWAARKSNLEKSRSPIAGLGFFMDMTNNKIAWEHTLEYQDVEETQMRGGDEEGTAVMVSTPSAALSKKNRIIGDVTKESSLVNKNPFFK